MSFQPWYVSPRVEVSLGCVDQETKRQFHLLASGVSKVRPQVGLYSVSHRANDLQMSRRRKGAVVFRLCGMKLRSG